MTHKRLITYLFNMKKLIRKILREESEWWEDIVNNFNKLEEKVEVEDIGNLRPGDNIHIVIYQDGIYIDSDAVYVEGDNPYAEFLIRLPKVFYTDSDENSTHCGRPRNIKDCDCQDSREDVGKCWFIDPDRIESIDLYPNKKGFNYINFAK